MVDLTYLQDVTQAFTIPKQKYFKKAIFIVAGNFN